MVNQMRAVGIREGLGGRSAFNALAWLALFIPSTLLVILQESATPFPHFGYVVLSAIAQHAAAGITALPGMVLQRFSRYPLPIWLAFVIWAALGVSRGVVGGLLASEFATVDPQFGFRIAVWSIVSCVWMPLFSYTVAQMQRRRYLLNALQEAVARRNAARLLPKRSAEEIRNQLLLTMQAAVTGSIEEIRGQLTGARASLGPAQLRMVGERLSSVSQLVGTVVDRLSETAEDERQRSPRVGAPLMSAIIFERRRPWSSSALAAGTLVAALGPLCVDVKGWPFLVDFGLAMCVVTLVLALGAHIVPSGLSQLLKQQVAWEVAHYGGAGLSGAVVLAAMHWGDLDSFTTVVILLVPCAVPFAAVIVSGATGLAAANRQASRSLAALMAEHATTEARAARAENDIRDQLARVVHGPVLGRLAACAMALNFHAAEIGNVPSERTEHVAGTVAKHLEAAAAELNSLIR
ncbi:MAG: hypothetical protein WED09_00925 [Homoserinimonas sp.]